MGNCPLLVSRYVGSTPSSRNICSGNKGRTGSFLREFLGFWLLPNSIRIISLDESNGF